MTLYQLEDFEDTSSAGFTKRMLRESPQGLAFVLNFEPGQTLPAHNHSDSDVFLTVIAGEGQAVVDGSVQPMRAGTLLHCTGKETLSVENTGPSRLSLLVFLSPGNPRFAGNVR